MTRRLGWLLLHIACGLAAVPGCNTLLHRKDAAPARDEKPRPAATTDTPQASAPKSRPGALAMRVEKRTPPERPHTLPPPDEADEGDAGEPVEPGPKVQPAGPVQPSRAEKPLPPLVEALRCMLEERHQDALRHLQAYDQETQEFFLRLLPTMTLFAKKRPDQLSPQEVGVVNEVLQGLLVTLRPRTELVIEQMCFCECESIKGFGTYQPLPANHAFVAAAGGRPGEMAELYFEVRNFASEPRDGAFAAHLPSSLEIRDAQGTVRKRYPNPLDQQAIRSATRLHDYYNKYYFLVPELEPGVYEVHLQVVDEAVPELRRVARKALEFRVTAGPAR